SNALFFDWDMGESAYVERFYGHNLLTYDSGSDEYTLVEEDGSQIVFAGFTSEWPFAGKGQLLSYLNANGNDNSVTDYAQDGKISQIETTNTAGSSTITKRYTYAYVEDGDNAGLLESVLLERKVDSGDFEPVQKVEYTYHDGLTDSGNL